MLIKRSGVLLLSTILILPITSLGANNGNSPNGKPFVEVQGQFVEVQNAIQDLESRMSDLVGTVSSLEEKVDASAMAITKLEDANAVIVIQINNLIAEAAANSFDIAGALSRIDEIYSQVAALKTDQAANAAAIDLLDEELSALNDFVVTNTAGLLSLRSEFDQNQVLITGLQNQIDEVNQALATKQNFLNATCPEGSALQAINQDGTYECEIATASGQFGLRLTSIFEMHNMASAYFEQRPRTCWSSSGFYTCYVDGPKKPSIDEWVISCPEGKLVQSGGLYPAYGVSVTSLGQWGNGWKFRAANYNLMPVEVVSFVNCLEVYEVAP